MGPPPPSLLKNQNSIRKNSENPEPPLKGSHLNQQLTTQNTLLTIGIKTATLLLHTHNQGS
jgi:hypothetical protein